MYLTMIVGAIVRRYRPIVYVVLIAGLLASSLAVLLRQEWLSYVGTGLLLVGIGLFSWTKPRDRVRSKGATPES